MDETMESSVVEQEVAAPAQEPEAEVSDNTVSEPGQDEGQEQPKELSDNDRWKIARQKAQREADERVQREIKAALAQRDAEFARRFGNFRNPKTGKPITTEQEYLETMDAQEEIARAKRIAETGKVTVEDMTAIAQRTAREEFAAQQQAMIQQAQVERMRVEGERQLQEQITELAKLDPSLKSLEDLPNMENFDKFDALVRSGLDLVSAYKVVNYDRAQKRTAEAAKQAAINSAKGTSHLSPVGGVGTDDQGISDSDMEMWKNFGFSPKEAREYHKRLNK